MAVAAPHPREGREITEARAPYRLTGTFSVPLPPDQAFRLFTPRGEQDWVPGWQPTFPAASSDDTAPGTVFLTDTDAEVTIWVVTEREQGRRIRYARVTPPDRAGTVTVTLAAAAAGSDVTVEYELTALTDAGELELREFAANYPAFLGSWHDAIAAMLTDDRPPNNHAGG